MGYLSDLQLAARYMALVSVDCLMLEKPSSILDKFSSPFQEQENGIFSFHKASSFIWREWCVYFSILSCPRLQWWTKQMEKCKSLLTAVLEKRDGRFRPPYLQINNGKMAHFSLWKASSLISGWGWRVRDWFLLLDPW